MRKHKILTAGILTCACMGAGFGLLFDRSFWLPRALWALYESHGYVVREHEYVNAMVVITLLAFWSARAMTNLAFRLVAPPPLPRADGKKPETVLIVATITLIAGGIYCLVSVISLDRITSPVVQMGILSAVAPILLVISFSGYGKQLAAEYPR